MKMLRGLQPYLFCLPGVFALAQAAPATATLDEQVAALVQIAAKDAQANPATPNEHLLNQVRQLAGAVLRKNYLTAINLAQTLSSESPSEETQKALHALIPTLQQAQENQKSATAEMVKTTQDHARQAIANTKDPKAFDSILAEIATAMNQARSDNYGTDRESTFNALEGTNRFVKGWQSYLVDQSTGNFPNAANDLRNLATADSSFMPIPRSELLERALKESGQTTQALGAQIELHSLDDLPAALAQIEIMQRNGNYGAETNALQNALQNLQNAYLAYQDKNYSGALQQLVNNPFGVAFIQRSIAPATSPGNQNSLHQEITKLKNALLLQVIQGLLNLPDAPAPQADELPSDYLLRLAGMKGKAADWSALQQVLQVYQQAIAPFNSQAWLQEDLSGLHAYLIGEKLEAAGQSLDAIRSYRQALATTGKFFPGEPPAAKLKDLQNKYPDLYQQALQQPIGSPRP